MIPRLTDNLFPAGNFDTCQLCGTQYNDICEFWLWQECDDNDEREEGNYLLVGRECCEHKIKEHPRLYWQVAWGRGAPGAFVLVCGDCPHREGFGCRHPNLRANGGQGLQVNFHNPLGIIHINYGPDDPRTGTHNFLVVSACEGNPSRPAQKP